MNQATKQATKQVVIVGAGFAGLNAAKRLRDVPGIAVTLLDRENHHLFQPLLYQVAMAALSPADIAVPIRSLFARARNIRVLKAQAQSVDVDRHMRRHRQRRVQVRLPAARFAARSTRTSVTRNGSATRRA